MKHNCLKHLFTALLLLYAMVVSAHDFEVDGIYYNRLSWGEKTVEVTYGGNNSNSYSNEYTGDVVIPENVTLYGTTYSVTSIGNYAFDACTGLTSITIPNSVTSIGINAFDACTGLTSITIPNSVTSIEESAFSGCTRLRNVTIGNGVTSIGDHAFYKCSSLTSITIPNSVTFISWNAFSGCSSLTSITIPNSVTSIGYNAFEGCKGLTSVTIGNSVTGIGKSAFSGCSSLTSIVVDKENSVYDSRDNCNAIIETKTNTLIAGCKNTVIPNSVTSIGSYAFFGCTGLTSVTIPNSVRSIGEYAFDGTAWYNNQPDGVIYAGKVLYKYKGTMPENTSLVIKDGILSISGRAFMGCTGLTSITIPNSVTIIGNDAFYGCTNLETVYNNSSLNFYTGSVKYGYIAYYANLIIVNEYGFKQIDGVNTLVVYNGKAIFITLPADYNGESYIIGAEAFKNNSSLTIVTIPNSVTSIGNRAFYDCTRLINVTIGNSVTSIGSYAFYDCTRLINVTIGNGVTSIGEHAFSYCTGLRSIEIPNSVTSIGAYAFSDCTGLTSITIPNSVTSIGGGAFYQCSSLASIEIPNSVTSIGSYAFRGCTGLTSVTIPNSVTSIGADAFYKCTGLTSITIPNSVTSIGNTAFYACSSMEELYIGSSIESIGDNAFASCDKIKEIKIALERPFAASTDIFSSMVYDNAVLYIPNGTESRYEKREPWNLFFDIIEMDFTGITLDKKSVALTEGNTTALVVIINLDGVTDKDIIWTTSDSSVATVDGGEVTAVAPGTATITATVGAYSTSCVVTVTDSPTLSIVYHIYQPYHRWCATSWAVGRGGDKLRSNVDLGIELDSNDPRQQFAILSDDGGNTYFLYHVTESKFICKDGSLSETPVDAIKFMEGAYSDTFFAYFDDSHYVNVGGSCQMTIDDWDTPDGGNSCVFLPVGEFDPTEALEAIRDFTGIDDVASESKDERVKSGTVYDLQGRKLSEITEPGIYIIDGKKVLVK